MMEYKRLLRRKLREMDTFERDHFREDEYVSRSQNKHYHRGVSAPIIHKLTYVEEDANTLRQYLERQKAKEAHRIKDIRISLLERKIWHLERKIRCTDREVYYSDEMFDYDIDEINDTNELSVIELEEEDELLYEQRYQQQQIENKIYEIGAEMDDIIMSKDIQIEDLKQEIECRDMEIESLQEILNRKTHEINKRNTYYFSSRLQGKDNQLISAEREMQQSLKRWRYKENELNKRIASSKATIESRDQNVRELEKMLNSKKINLEEKDRQLSEKELQLHKTSKRLEDTEANMEEAVSSLKENNRYLHEELKRRNLDVRRLKEMLESKKIAINGKDGEQVNRVMRQKDDHITDLKQQLKQALTTLEEKETEMNGMIAALKKNTEDLQKQVKRRDKTITDLEKTLDYQKKERIDQNELKKKDLQYYEERDEQQRSLKQMHENEAELEGIIAALEKKIRHLEAEMEHRNLRSKQPADVLNSTMSKIPEKDETNRDAVKMENRIAELTSQLDLTLTKLHETKTELDETKTRLSKAMGNMLTDNNPNIADLSDKNRPTKLSERYAELYDNQWTDAFDILEKHFHTEESAIAALLLILKDAMSFCRNKACEQMKDLRRLLAFANNKDDGGISTDLGKLLKDCRKAMASLAIRNLYQMYMSHISQSTDETIRAALHISSFTKECLEVCWFMAIQDPPVVFAPELREGSKFNTDLFKPYTSSGTHVDYVVWPALLLHEGGPVLTKGVAQGKGKKST